MPWNGSNKADGFQIEFSGSISVSEMEMSPEARKSVVRATTYAQDGGTYAYLVGATLSKNGIDFEKAAAGAFANAKCKTKTDIPLNVPGARALEWVGIDCPDGWHIEARYFTRGKWLYQVLALVTAGGDVESARYFLRSFKLL